ncbi:hypothetical protein [Hansschlegelia plantiphila]|uniref:Twin-arginine translocation pathway signal n=1 Tax=Hansschlegelia plantiphila TaxID=374655 RepID=A0A9W6J0G5_9HYPH|nr:hypothetical protein [Hansschlegelia plantiphila]GLK67159.1 hypothetical protein GCM10008179_07970 [Hansschlegelia plantiphila]
MHRVVIVAAALSLTACARSPDGAAPFSASQSGLEGYSCGRLGEESLRLSAALATIQTQQEKLRLKAEQDAVQRASTIKRCDAPRFQAAAAPIQRHTGY